MKKRRKKLKIRYYFNNAYDHFVTNTYHSKKIKKKKAGIDVFIQEPHSKDNPLFKLDNVLVTPYSARVFRISRTVYYEWLKIYSISLSGLVDKKKVQP